MTERPRPRLEHLPAPEAARVEMTLACRDADSIPKVEGAGEVVDRDGRRVQVMHNGVLIEADCYQGPWMTELIRCLRGHHEPQEERVFHELVGRFAATEPEPTMVELGSWWAYYSLWFASALPNARVVAMEPDPVYLEVGRRNFALNGLEATFVHGAIGDRPGSDVWHVSERTNEALAVPCHDLRSLLRAAGLERISLLLADIQGAETLLLEHNRDALAAGTVRFVVLSTHHHSISGSPLTHQHARELLASFGAHVVAEHTVGESFSGDGLVAASFDARDRSLRVPVSRARSLESQFGELEHDLAAAWSREEDLRRRLTAAERRRLVPRLRRAWRRLARAARSS